MRFLRYYNFIIILLVTSGQILSQNLDSLFNRYVESKTGRGEESGQTTLSNSPSEKCLFGLNGAVRTNFDQFTPQQQSILKVLFGRPVLETSFVSPKGFFRIHYDLKGDERTRI